MSEYEKLLEWGKWFLERFPSPSEENSRFTNLRAKGGLNDKSKKNEPTWEFDIDLKKKREALVGTGLIGKGSDFDELEFQGVLVQGNIGVLNYRSKDKRKLLAGSLTIQMSNDGNNLVGAYSGFGPKTKGVIYGDLVLSIIS